MIKMAWLPPRRRRICWVSATLLFLSLTIGSADAYAQRFIVYPGYSPSLEPSEYKGNMRVGPVYVHPGLAVSERYTDNAFLTPDDESEQLISIISPSLALQLPMQAHTFQLEYQADISRWGQFEHYSTEDHHALALADLQFGRRLNLKIADTFLRSSTPPDFLGDTRDEFNFNTTTIQATYKFGQRYTLEADYTHSLKDFDGSTADIDNFKEDSVGTTLFYRVLPKTWALLEYRFARVDNNDEGGISTDNDNHRVWTGLYWEPTAKLRGTAKGGFIKRDYDQIDEDRSSFGMQANVQYSATPRTTLDLFASRELIQTEETLEQGGFGVDYYRTGVRLVLRHKLRGKIYGTVEGSYFNDDYNSEGTVGKERNDDRVSFGLGLEYHLRDWLAFRARYEYINNDSNIPIEDYEDNEVFFTVSLIF